MATKTKSKTTTQRAPRRRPADSLNRREAATLADVSLRSVDKAIEEKVVKPKRSRRQGTLLDHGDVLAIALIARAGLPLRPQTKRRINEWVHGFPSEKDLEETRELLLSDVLVLRFDKEVRQLAERVYRYLEDRPRFIESNPDVRQGEPVIAGTRLPVRAVSERVKGGDSIDDLLDDYPQVSREALETALIYAQSHPRRGRPARPWRDA